MCRQNPESATGRPTSKIRVFWGILDAAAESRVRAGGSNIQNPRLLGEFGCRAAESRVRGTEYRILISAESMGFDHCAHVHREVIIVGVFC